jgi:hypothetical protein
MNFEKPDLIRTNRVSWVNMDVDTYMEKDKEWA